MTVSQRNRHPQAKTSPPLSQKRTLGSDEVNIPDRERIGSSYDDTESRFKEVMFEIIF